MTSGKSSQLVVIDPETGKVLQHVPLPADQQNQIPDVASPNILKPDREGQVSYTGLVFSPDGKQIFLSNVNGSIKVFRVEADGAIVPSHTMKLPAARAPRRPAEIPSGLAISPDGKTIVWTSVKDGDLDLYAMNLDGTGIRRLTDDVGYDGGAFFSPDSKRIVYRAAHPTDPAEVERYKDLLAQHLVEPGQLEIFVMNADGSGQRPVTSNGASNFSPYFHPDGKRIIFSSNVDTRGEGGRPSFHLYLVGDDGTGIERLTFEGQFNSFPMFSPDGKRLVWASDRNAAEKLTNVKLYVPRDVLPDIEEDETFYHADLIGLDAFTQDGAKFGTVATIHNFGAGDIVEIRRESGDLVMLPFTETVVPEVDIAKKRIVVAPPIETESEEDE